MAWMPVSRGRTPRGAAFDATDEWAAAMSRVILRSYRLGKDALAMADLAEAAYVEDYARMDRSARAEMERERRLEMVLRLARIVFPPLRDAGRGLVYECDRAIASAVMFTRDGLAGDRWTIDTVATHPDHQRRGLARRLLAAALDEIARRGGRSCMLKVREDNAPAYHMYRGAGFTQFDTTVHLKRETVPGSRACVLEGYRLRELTLKEWYGSWRERLDLARRETPKAVQSISPIAASRFRKSRFVRLLAPLAIRMAAMSMHHWAVEHQEGLVATLAVRGDVTGNRNHEIDLVIDPEHEEALAGSLLDLGLSALVSQPHASTLVETRSTNEHVLAELAQREFSVMSTWHWLGREIEPPGRSAREVRG